MNVFYLSSDIMWVLIHSLLDNDRKLLVILGLYERIL